MRRVIVAFDYLYVDLGSVDLDIATGVYSQKDEDLVYFVLPFHGTIEDFHALDRKFTEVHCGMDYIKSGEYIACQAKYFKEPAVLMQKYHSLIIQLNQYLNNLTDKEEFSYYL